MPFDIEGFKRATLVPRTTQVRVPGLKDDWFGPDDDPVFTVRGLSADELAFAQDAFKRNQRALGIATGLASNDIGELSEKVREALSEQPEKHPTVALRQAMIRLGTVDPVLDETAASKIARGWPIELNLISEAINGLTGRGAEAKKKPQTATPTPASKT